MRHVLALALVPACVPAHKPGSDRSTDTAEGRPADGGEDSGRPDEDSDGDGFLASEDCNDADPAISPAAEERCDGQDNDCDGEIDETGENLVPVYADQDGDGFGTGALLGTGCATPEARQAAVDGDCDDTDSTITPAYFAPESGEGRDRSAELRAAGPEAVTSLTWTEPGTLRLCPGTWPLALELRADLRIEGVQAGTELTGLGSARPLTVLEDGLRLELVAVDLVDGRATSTADAPFGEATSAGGHLLCDADATVLLQDLRLLRGHAGQGGSLFLGGRCDATIENVVMESNTADDFGGSIGAHRAGALTLREVEISHSRAELGGALGIDGGSLSWSGGALHDNSARRGSLWLHEAYGQLAGLEVTDNLNEELGAITVWDGSLELTGSELARNSVEDTSPSLDGEGGGALMVYNSEVTVRQSRFLDNRSARDGGAVLAGLYAELNIEDTEFSDNSAELRGGALAVDSGTLTLVGSSFADNSARTGGALSCVGATSTAQASDTSFLGNSASNGGAVACEGRELVFDAVTLRNNAATGSGGALLVSGGALTLEDTVAEGNTASDGAGLYLYSTAATLTALQLSQNSASAAGGGLMLVGGSYAALQQATIEENAAAQGGGLWVDQFASLDGSALSMDRNTPSDVYSKLSGALELGAATTLHCDGSGCE